MADQNLYETRLEKQKDGTFRVKPSGAYIRDALRLACEMAKQLKSSLTISLSDVRLEVSPNADVDRLMSEFRKKLG